MSTFEGNDEHASGHASGSARASARARAKASGRDLPFYVCLSLAGHVHGMAWCGRHRGPVIEVLPSLGPCYLPTYHSRALLITHAKLTRGVVCLSWVEMWMDVCLRLACLQDSKTGWTSSSSMLTR